MGKINKYLQRFPSSLFTENALQKTQEMAFPRPPKLKNFLGLEGGGVHFKSCYCQGGGGVQFSYVTIFLGGGKF